ncbi:MAG: hypothetical protein D6B25_11455 [Desulfobulbaceae bacterium]|nr:MAG: hypothetical protein D6B25_11455 [Desulfobulbaceae bacterium]
MEHNETGHQEESLGALFRRLRLERALDISDISDETRIPPKTVRAIEADDCSDMPAPAFSKGFYSLYAKMLGLDQDEISQRFINEIEPQLNTEFNEKSSPPSITQKQVGTMAARSTVTPGSIIGFSILVIILFFGGISWYAGFNPATHLSKWLRSYYQEPVVETPTTQTSDFDSPTDYLPAADDLTSPETAAVSEADHSPAPAETEFPAFPAEVVPETPPDVKYQLVAEFPQSTTISIGVDEEEKSEIKINGGTIKTWNAKTNIILDLPKESGARLYLNGITIPLPETDTETISISIPEYLLD